MQGPRILAGFVQGTLASLEPEARARVCRRLPAEALAAIERSSRLAWLPVGRDVELTHAIYAELGAGRAREQFRRNLSAALDTPILRSLAQGALRLFGASPARVFAWAPRVYAQIYREAGAMRFERVADDAARLELAGLPAEVARSRDYLDGIAGSIAAGFDLLGVKGEVSFERFEPARAQAAFRLAWEEDDEPAETLPAPARA